ncbi:uncharacterized protein LOC112463508 isoform X2 [Temnothorax curvispinosus]|nr:uncharacterized protein LOC112463508 isoform X2 [Temnothorax curvispinosus]
MMNYSEQIKNRNFQGIFESEQESSSLDDVTNTSRHSKKAETGTINSVDILRGIACLSVHRKQNFRPHKCGRTCDFA